MWWSLNFCAGAIVDTYHLCWQAKVYSGIANRAASNALFARATVYALDDMDVYRLLSHPVASYPLRVPLTLANTPLLRKVYLKMLGIQVIRPAVKRTSNDKLGKGPQQLHYVITVKDYSRVHFKK